MQRFDQQVVDRKPDRPAPVGVATKKPALGLGRLIVDGVRLAIHMKLVRIFSVESGNRADTELGQKFIFIQHRLQRSNEVIAIDDRQKTASVLAFGLDTGHVAAVLQIDAVFKKSI